MFDDGYPRRSLPGVDHYAESFCLPSGQCFRFVQAEDGTGHAQHCPYFTERQGWIDRDRSNGIDPRRPLDRPRLGAAG
jgi:hypothetical protein